MTGGCITLSGSIKAFLHYQGHQSLHLHPKGNQQKYITSVCLQTHCLYICCICLFVVWVGWVLHELPWVACIMLQQFRATVVALWSYLSKHLRGQSGAYDRPLVSKWPLFYQGEDELPDLFQVQRVFGIKQPKAAQIPSNINNSCWNCAIK